MPGAMASVVASVNHGAARPVDGSVHAALSSHRNFLKSDAQPMPDPAAALADRIEAALARIEAARSLAATKLAALEGVVEASVADLDRLLTPAEPN